MHVVRCHVFSDMKSVHFQCNLGVTKRAAIAMLDFYCLSSTELHQPCSRCAHHLMEGSSLLGLLQSGNLPESSE